ncbi:MAG: tRNA (5-methylaminomethyl-2-thiouridine)(34)-methyltransferase MnmD [Saprospiraceae bacterium]
MTDLVIFDTQDGSHSVFSATYGVSYHSKYGAIQESEHVFIKAGLFEKALAQPDIAILEIGFGTGLNAFLSLIDAKNKGLHIDYVAVENYPLPFESAKQLNYPEELRVPSLRPLFEQMHSMEWGIPMPISPNFTFTKWLKDFQALDFEPVFDIIFFDAFAPSAQPELWEEDMLRIMYKSLKNNGILVTYCAKGIVKRALKTVGFTVESLKGPPGKREMTRAKKRLENSSH